MAKLDLLPAWLLAKSAGGGLYQRHNRQIFKSGRGYALERLRAARGKELGQAIGWEACSNLRIERSTGARFLMLRAGCKSGEGSRNLQGKGESCLLATPCTKSYLVEGKYLFTEQVPS
jgi:hypothetical protein